MKNTQIKGVITCLAIFVIALTSTMIAVDQKIYPLVFIGIFLVISSVAILILFIQRAICMDKMLKGENVLASWQYSEKETLKIIEAKEVDKKGILFLAFPFFSLVIIIVALTVGITTGNVLLAIGIVLVILIGNIKLFNGLSRIEEINRTLVWKEAYHKMSFVYLADDGIYALGLLHVWKGWGSRLKQVEYEPTLRHLSCTYSYLKAYGFGRYTVTVTVPEDQEIIQSINDLKRRHNV